MLFGLGKLGRREYSSDKIKGAVFGTEVIKDLQNQGVNYMNLITDNFIDDTVSESFYRLIVNSVNEARNTESN
jgi:hypothetical protein